MNPFTFRPGTCDANVYRSVVELNEYRLPDALAPEGLILDVGGHIGSFTRACLDRGARRIVAFEPDPENFCRFRAHLAEEIQKGWVTVLPVAVGGYGIHPLVNLTGYLRAPDEVNTGGARLADATEASRLVPAVSLDNFLRHHEPRPVALLKLDCEGAEWDIVRLLDARQAGRVAAVCGELHPVPPVPDRLAEAFLPLLRFHGFEDARFEPHGEDGLGLFWAKRTPTAER
jgi:FkbM family methyltransferase